jgi:hypothetical protein
MKILFLSIIIALTLTTVRGQKISWEDNINNPANLEYLQEVVFNNNIDTTDKKTMQYFFCKRYYETLTASSKLWYDNKKNNDTCKVYTGARGGKYILKKSQKTGKTYKYYFTSK